MNRQGYFNSFTIRYPRCRRAGDDSSSLEVQSRCTKYSKLWYWCFQGKYVNILSLSFSYVAFLTYSLRGAWWRFGRVDAFRPQGHGFDSRSNRHVGTLFKSWDSAHYPCCVGSALCSRGLEESLLNSSKSHCNYLSLLLWLNSPCNACTCMPVNMAVKTDICIYSISS